MAFSKPAFARELTPRLLRIYVFASIGAMNFGYDNNWWSGVINLDAFNDRYGRAPAPGEPKTLPSDWLSIASGTPIAGWIVGCFIASYLTTWLGRKKTIVIVCVIAIIGMIMQCAIQSYWGIMAGRLVNALSMGIEANCVPMYMAELAPSSIRGGLVNFYQTWLYIGGVLAAATVYGSTTNLVGKWTYMTPIVVQLGPPVLLLAAVWFIPESPRWLLCVGRRADALDALEYIRKGVSTPEETETELNLIEQAMLHEEENHRATGYASCFKGSNLHRTLIAIGVQCLQQAQGNSFITTYLVIFLKQVGVDDPQLIACASLCCSLAGCIIAFYLSDKIGRRPMFLGGSFFMAALMWTVSGLASWTPGDISGSSAQGCIAAMLLYQAFAAASWGSVMWAVTAEVATTQLRERTIAIATMASFSTSILITYVNPFMQNEPGNLGPRVGMIYGSISILAIFFVFFVVPELKGRSLEELDELFHSRVKPWRSTSFVATGIGAQISAIEGVVKMDGAREKRVDEEDGEVEQDEVAGGRVRKDTAV